MTIRDFVHTFAGNIHGNMKEYKLTQSCRCLECGAEITWGRSDKKFCKRSCKDNYHNKLKQLRNSHRVRVDSVLECNYKILEDLLKMDVDWIPLAEATGAGFQSGYATGFTRVAGHYEYSCYDICFRISATRIFNIRRLSLTLPPLKNK